MSRAPSLRVTLRCLIVVASLCPCSGLLPGLGLTVPAGVTPPTGAVVRNLVIKLAEVNRSAVIFPRDVLRLANAMKIRPKFVVIRLEPEGLILGERRLQTWRTLAAGLAPTNHSKATDPSTEEDAEATDEEQMSEQGEASNINTQLDEEHFSAQIRAVFWDVSSEQLDVLRKGFLPFSEVVRVLGDKFEDLELKTMDRRTLQIWRLWFPCPLLLSSESKGKLKALLKEHGLSEELASGPMNRSSRASGRLGTRAKESHLHGNTNQDPV
mmetsp:Transcript_19227/g.37153  ORF Transcript_19227/g.37153 Transcript_19227/m.37153 type:complete len:268 (-) Transcript_19227:246-1049(-)